MSAPLQKVLALHEPFGRYTVEKAPIPKPATGQLLVKLAVTALNPGDWKLQLLGMWTDSYPLTLGFDGAGTVVDLGEGVTGFSKGDRVIFQGWYDEKAKIFHGTFREYHVPPAHIVAKIPNNISFEEAATLFTCVATMGISFFSHKPESFSVRLTPPWQEEGVGKYAGKSLFVPGGSTIVAHFGFQIAKLSGFSPIITTASLQNADRLKALGATHVIDRHLPVDKIREQVLAIAGGPVDYAYDAVSDEYTIDLCVDVLRQGGYLVYVLLDKMEYVERVTEGKGLGGTVWARGFQALECNRGALAELWEKLPEWLEKGVIKPARYEVLPGGLSGVEDGLARLQNNEVHGVKLVARIDKTP